MRAALTEHKAHSIQPLSTLPPSLEAAVQGFAEPVRDGHYVRPPDPSPAVVQMARVTLIEAFGSCAAVRPDILRAWFGRLVDALPIGGAKDDPNRVRNALSALATTCGEFPAECFTAETLKVTLQKCRFFPTGAELFEILDPINRRVKARATAIKQIADFVPKPDEWTGPTTDDERAQMAQKMRALAENMVATAAVRAPETPKVEPKYLTKLQLAIGAHPDVLAIRPDLRKALADHEASQAARR
jgi:hypothetical protein